MFKAFKIFSGGVVVFRGVFWFIFFEKFLVRMGVLSKFFR